MVWHSLGTKPLSEPIMTKVHLWQWVKETINSEQIKNNNYFISSVKFANMYSVIDNIFTFDI